MRRGGTPARNARLPGFRPGGALRVLGLWAALGASALAATAAAPGVARAQTLLTQDEALELAFPGTTVDRRSAFLTEPQLDRARELAGDEVDIDQGVVTYYVGENADGYAGAAYFDVHRVRTKNEIIMVVVNPDDTVRRVDVVKFMEPGEYIAPDAWIAQFDGRELDDALSTRGEIHNITGATLTARAMTRAVRRVLAFHHVIQPFGDR